MKTARPALQRHFAETFQRARIDALIAPTTPRVAVEQGPPASSLETFLLFIRNTDPGSNAGIPGVTIPAGLGPTTGLPIGISLDGPRGSDTRLLAIGMAIEQGDQARKHLEDRIDALLGAAADESHAEIVAHAEAGKDLASLRHVAEAAPGPRVRGLVGDIDPVEEDAAALGGDEAHQRLQQRRLSHAVVAEDADELAGGDLEPDPV